MNSRFASRLLGVCRYTLRLALVIWIGLVVPMLCIPGLSSEHHRIHLVFSPDDPAPQHVAHASLPVGSPGMDQTAPDGHTLLQLLEFIALTGAVVICAGPALRRRRRCDDDLIRLLHLIDRPWRPPQFPVLP